MNYKSGDSDFISQGYSEYIVAKKTDGKDILIRAGIVLAGIILAIVMLGLTLKSIPSASFLFLVFIIGITAYALTFTNIEFEYSIAQSELQVDKIYGKRRRRKMLEIEFSAIEKIAPKQQFENYIKTMQIHKTLTACRSKHDENVFGILYIEKGNQKSVLYLNVIKKTMQSFQYYRRSVVETGDIVL